MSNISQIIKERRIELGLKAKEVAQQIGVAESTYRDWEQGRKILGEPYIKIAETLQIPLWKLLGKEADESTLLFKEIENLEQSLKTLKKRVVSLI